MVVLTAAVVHAARSLQRERTARSMPQRRCRVRSGLESTLARSEGRSVRQRLLQIGDDVFLVLDADRQPHHVRAGAGLRPSARR